jgi:hypothetical protein
MVMIDFERFSSEPARIGPTNEMLEQVLIDLVFGEYRCTTKHIMLDQIKGNLQPSNV